MGDSNITFTPPSLAAAALGASQPTNGTMVLGQNNDMNSREGRVFAHIWGHQPHDQQQRASAWTHLQAVPAGDRTYDLRKLEDLRAFLGDLENGKLDGNGDTKGFQGVSVTAEGKVLVGGKTYDITKPGDMHALLRDNADGELDGRTGEPVLDKVEPAHPQPLQAKPLQGVFEATVSFLPVGFPGHTPADSPSATKGKPNVVMYDGETYDVGNEAGRDALQERLAADGIDYDPITNEVSAGDRTYDLESEKGRRGFLMDGKDGLLDGKSGNSARNVVYDGASYDTKTEKGRKALEKAIEGFGVEYDRASNKVKVEGKSYDLDTDKGRRAFRNDLKDGVLDGQAAKKPAEKVFNPRPEYHQGIEELPMAFERAFIARPVQAYRA
jgi:hypothetical protein